MSRLRVVLMGLAVLIVVMATGVATADAEDPNLLPTTNGTKLTIKGGAGTLKGALVIKCTGLTGSGETTGGAGKLATIDLLFKGCEAVGAKCKSLESTEAGSILVKGEFHLRASLSPSTATIGVTLLKVIHLECSILLAEIRTTGETGTDKESTGGGGVGCPITPVKTKVKTTEHYTLTCAENTETKKQAVQEWDNEALTGMESSHLEVSESHGAFGEGQEVQNAEVSLNVESEIMT
jgi:hypothetical protein